MGSDTEILPPANLAMADDATTSAGLSAAARSARRSGIGFIVMAILQTGSLASFGYCVWIYDRVVTLGEIHGWGQIPAEALPASPDQMEGVITNFSNASSVFYLLGFVAFLYGMGTSRSIITNLLGKDALQFGWGLTIGSIIIPLYSLYRPWAGFGEIYRAISHMAASGIADRSWKQTGISPPTFFLGVVFIMGTALSKVWSKEAEDALAGESGLASLGTYLGWLEAVGLCYVAIFAVVLIYAFSLTRHASALVKKLSLRSVVSQF